MVDNPDDGFQSQAALADFGMAVLVGIERRQAVIQMDCLEAVQSDDAVKFRQHPVQVIDNIVACAVDMAGIKADPQMAAQLRAVDDGFELLKAAANLRALAGHGFQQHGGGLLWLQHLIEEPGNQLDSLF